MSIQVNVPHSQARPRTYATPSRMSCTIVLRSPSSRRRAAGRAARKAIATAPITNDAASMRNAAPVPAAAITIPPSAGPMNRYVSGCTV